MENKLHELSVSMNSLQRLCTYKDAQKHYARNLPIQSYAIHIDILNKKKCADITLTKRIIKGVLVSYHCVDI